MNNIIKLLTIAILISLMSCNNTKENRINTEKKNTEKENILTDEFLENAVIYEVNLRQYSPEGTINAFSKDIEKLKNLGVKIIWLMPIHPISELKRKAEGDKLVSEISNIEKRKKYLGSPYSVSDYKSINPDLGTLQDLKNLVQKAHQNNMIVILDWVANHTGWDHKWITEHPEYYTKNLKGEITEPLNEDGTLKGWGDVADLNYENQNLRKKMIEQMKYWVDVADIDGFRCDVAGEVPVSFWKEAIENLRKEKNLFMLAEAWEPELLKNDLFDACYAWEGHFLMVDIAKGKKSVKDWDNYIKKIDTMYENDDILMNFTSNHDENSWKGTVYESFGDAWEVMAVTTYMIKGMPLLYSGQEYGLRHRLKFFEKDSIPKNKGKEYNLYVKLGKLKNSITALNDGKNPADYERLNVNNENILAFKRSKDNSSLIFMANFSEKEQKFLINISGNFKDAFNGSNQVLEKQSSITLPPWGYKVFVNLK